MPKKYLVDCDGEMVSIREYCRRKGINSSKVYMRIKETGKSPQEIIDFYGQGGFNRNTCKNNRLNKIWWSMLDRCSNPNNHSYDYYYECGIKVSELWESYKNFEKDMYDSYIEHVEKYGEKDTTLDRIDVTKDYCKENCRWATWKEQARNRRNSLKLPTGELLINYCERKGLDYVLIYHRLRNGYTLEEAESKPKKVNDSLIGNIKGDLLVLDRIDNRYAKCKCLICGKELKKRWDILKQDYPTCSCRRGKKVQIGENNYTSKELSSILSMNNNEDLEDISKDNWLQMIRRVHKDEYFQKQEKERSDKGNARIKLYYNNKYISLHKLAELKNIDYNKLTTIKYNTNKEYIDILKDDFNLDIVYEDYKYIVK